MPQGALDRFHDKPQDPDPEDHAQGDDENWPQIVDELSRLRPETRKIQRQGHDTLLLCPLLSRDRLDNGLEAAEGALDRLDDER